MASPSTAAKTIECSDEPLDLSFHPTCSYILAAALVDGTVELHDFRNEGGDDEGDDDDTLVSSTAVHTQYLPTREGGSTKESCRAVQFSTDGNSLWTAGSGGDIACLEAATVSAFSSRPQKPVRWRIAQASKAPIQVLHEHPSHLLVSGDEAGGIQVWDPRLHDTSTHLRPTAPVLQWKEHEDYVSAFDHSLDGTPTLLATSADGSLSVYDFRMPKQPGDKGFIRKSDNQDDELLSIVLMKNGKKVVCGTGEGVLSVFSYGTWGDVSDRFPGHPASIDAMVKVDEDTVVTGSSDGFIRVVSIHPDKFIGVLSDNHEGFPIEKLEFNADRNFLGSVTHDRFIRLWDARILQEDYEEADDVKMMGAAPPPVAASTTKTANQCSDEEWEDMDDVMEVERGNGSSDGLQEDDSDDSDDDEERPKSKNDKRAGRLKTDNERFFEDL